MSDELTQDEVKELENIGRKIMLKSDEERQRLKILSKELREGLDIPYTIGKKDIIRKMIEYLEIYNYEVHDRSLDEPDNYDDE